jgi:hypothetical protein
LLVVIVELQEQLLAWERELDSREGALIAWEESLMTFARALREASVECGASHTLAAVTPWDFFAHMNASISQSERLKPIASYWMIARHF